ncbi:Ppx/GppA phosphatase family protein [Acrocarpospora macrocephala]|uniref:Hydrolase n=1 Tax=Acrocarpospora macrocephala TaxID=150177 RepID=A0A5M3WKL8_9ACTN|nr:Ppx/GppA phosphatase family protein [Acrocarpospora macrocephala]GES09156.1 hydrolase [Acrocarpospora macrocephala]
MSRVAAIDCGTNSVRLLITDIKGETQTDLERRMEIVRLGQGVDRTGMLAPDALRRTFDAMCEYRRLIRRHATPHLAGPVGLFVPSAGVATTGLQCADLMPVRVVATSATRDATNRDEFVAGVREIFGVDPEVITGHEEAELSFTGATRSISGIEPPYLVVDIGGGSTEFVLGNTSVDAALSVDIGCVRLTERHTGPNGLDVAGVIRDVEAALAQVEQVVPIRTAKTLIGLAGSVTTVAGIALDLPEYDPEKIHHSRIPAAQVHEIASRLPQMTHEQRAAIPVMHPGRVDVISTGATILDQIMRHYGFADVVVSEHDILDGIAWSIA